MELLNSPDAILIFIRILVVILFNILCNLINHFILFSNILLLIFNILLETIKNIVVKINVSQSTFVCTLSFSVLCISLSRVLLSISLCNTFHLANISSPAISLSTLTTTHEGMVELVKRCLGAMIRLDGELCVLCYSHILRLEDNIVGVAFLCTTHDGSSRVLDASISERRKNFTCILFAHKRTDINI